MLIGPEARDRGVGLGKLWDTVGHTSDYPEQWRDAPGQPS